MDRVPSLTAKSLVEFSRKSPAARRSTLRKQKFPGDGDSKHQIPYYGPVAAAIRSYFADGLHNSKELNAAKNKALSNKLKSKRENLIRAIQAFEKSSLSKKNLLPAPNARHSATASGLKLRANPEMTATEGGRKIHFFFHFGAAPLDTSQAQILANVICWILRQEERGTPANSIEIWDVPANNVFKAQDSLPGTAQFINDNVREALRIWPELSPS